LKSIGIYLYKVGCKWESKASKIQWNSWAEVKREENYSCKTELHGMSMAPREMDIEKLWAARTKLNIFTYFLTYLLRLVTFILSRAPSISSNLIR
jgi:hypothetical protein